jgi:hypothetical protein
MPLRAGVFGCAAAQSGAPGFASSPVALELPPKRISKVCYVAGMKKFR